MQQNNATLISDLNTIIKVTEGSDLQKIARPFKAVQFQARKIIPSSKSLKKTENVLSHLKTA